MGLLSRFFKPKPVATAFGPEQKKLRLQKTIMSHLQNRIEDLLAFDEIRQSPSAVAMLSSAYARLVYACQLTEALVKGSTDDETQRWYEHATRTALRDLNAAMYNLHEKENLTTFQEAYDRLLELRLRLRQRLKVAA